MDYTDDVNGTIIGRCKTPYEFWVKEPIGGEIVDVKFGKGFFESDQEAINFLKTKHPEHYTRGIEIRIF